MSAKRIILKRSSLAGKRPSSEMLSPGEIALNTNSLEPGLFWETTDGNVVKAGPTAVLPYPPTQFPEKGETWFSTEDGTLKVGDAERMWRSIAAPYLGGSGTVVFVAPEFRYSSDSLRNDGQALPYQTINRAVLELTKIYLSRVLGGLSRESESNRYTIYLAPSKITAFNGPGSSLEDFSVSFSEESLEEATVPELEQFNSESGGIIIPSGITIIGMDLKRCDVSPTYVPTYSQPFLSPQERDLNQPLSSIFRCSGNSYTNNFSVTDKLEVRVVTKVSDENNLALFESERPHGLAFNERVGIFYEADVDQSGGSFSEGVYYAIPRSTFSFFLSKGSQVQDDPSPYVAFSEIPSLASNRKPKFRVTNSLNSAHRLRAFENASLDDIALFFTKVQKAFSSFFGGKVTDGYSLVNSSDHVIVAPLAPYPENTLSNTTRNSSFYANQVNLRSDFGMNWGDFDGSLVSGFRSVIAYSCTAVSLQNDPAAYEIYTTLSNPETNEPEERWWSLPLAAYLSLPEEERPSSVKGVSRSLQLSILNETPINNIRYFYQNLLSPSGKSLGITDIDQDFRHFGFRVRNGAFGQFQSTYTVGPAIGVWALNGGVCNLTNSTSNFGSVAIKSEGFLGINSIGGAKANSKGFVLEGVQRPLSLTRSQVESDDNKRILSLGGKITDVYIDPEDPNIQIVELNSDFSPCHLLPFSLPPGSAVWVETEECTYRAFSATDGGPTVLLGQGVPGETAKLRLRSSDSTIPSEPGLLPVFGVPYIRRFSDPRKEFERSYSLFIRNTNPNAIAPQVGSVLRLNQTSQALGSTSLKPNVQFDPGVLGGWGRIFTIDALETGNLGSSPQFNYVIGDSNQDQTYFIAVTASDYSRPWNQGPAFKIPAGGYTTFKNRNWYAAENNLWNTVYYGDAEFFTENSGPYSISPTEQCSPFVDTSVIERQDLVSESYQGLYAQDPFLGEGQIQQGFLTGGYENQTYFRGSTDPYPTYPTLNTYDEDDSSESMGLCLRDIPDGPSTFTVSPIVEIQSEEFPSLFPTKRRYRPSVIEFSVLSPTGIPNPKQTSSVLRIGTDANYEFVRVINLNGSLVRGIRLSEVNSGYTRTAEDGNWSLQTPVTVCSINPIPTHLLYDPNWTSTKKAVFRFFEIMGYPNEVLLPYLKPEFWGDRILPIQALSGFIPQNGYALTTDKWPLEFNQPSTIIANTHTWAYPGFYNYSRGLPEFQSNDFTRKLSSDYQATATWSGRLTLMGVNDKGEIVQFGPQRQALTGNFYEPISPASHPGNQQIYEEQEFVEFPSQVMSYSADDISELFNGSTSSFELRRSGLSVPANQLSQNSVIVTLGAIVQKPGEDYQINGNSLQFISPPQTGLSCNVRVVTSADQEKTLKVVSLILSEPFDGTRTIFTATSSDPNELEPLVINPNNTFVYLGGVQQVPLSDVNAFAPFSYAVERTSPTEVQFIFTGAPPEGTTIDIRCFCTGSYWSLREVFPVRVYSLDNITPLFDGAQTVFPLTYAGQIVNASTVTSDNLIISLGGAVQIPGVSYVVENSQLSFLNLSDPPTAGTSIDLRVISNAEFISCGVSGKYGSNFLTWGPGIVLSLANDAGILNSI